LADRKRGASKEGIRALLGPDVKVERAGKPKTDQEGDQLMEEAIRQALKSPRVSVHSPLTSAVMRYLKLKEPNFSISSELRSILEEEVKRRYPEISKKASELLLRVKEDELRKRLGF